MSMGRSSSNFFIFALVLSERERPKWREGTHNLPKDGTFDLLERGRFSFEASSNNRNER